MFELGKKVGVKICGITTADEASRCAAAGADMLGLNFSPSSPRCITCATAVEIATAVRARFPGVKLVGVFADQPRDILRKIATDLTLDAVQLHGNETVEDVVVAGGGDPGWSGLSSSQPSPGSAPPATRRALVIKALPVASEPPAFALYAEHCDAILLDTWNEQSPGGTGRTFPWSIAAEIRPRVSCLILAGGLTSENVEEAIRTVRPWAVDVCSGVELVPGRKDPAKVSSFLKAVAKSQE